MHVHVSMCGSLSVPTLYLSTIKRRLDIVAHAHARKRACRRTYMHEFHGCVQETRRTRPLSLASLHVCRAALTPHSFRAWFCLLVLLPR